MSALVNQTNYQSFAQGFDNLSDSLKQTQDFDNLLDSLKQTQDVDIFLGFTKVDKRL
jgi:hypothetical protein